MELRGGGMRAFEVQIPDELAELMNLSAAEIAGEPRVAFELFLNEIGIPTVFYDKHAYEQDLRGIAEAEGRARSS